MSRNILVIIVLLLVMSIIAHVYSYNKYSTLKEENTELTYTLENVKRVSELKEEIGKELYEIKSYNKQILSQQIKELKEIEYEINSTYEGRYCNRIPDDVLRLLNYQGTSD